MLRYICIFIVAAGVFLGTDVSAAEIPELSGENGFNSLVESIYNGEELMGPDEILSEIISSFTKEIRMCAKEIIVLVITAMMSGVISLLSENRKGSGSEAAFFCCFTFMSASALNCFNYVLQYGKDAIEAMTAFISKLSPLLMITLIACGNTVSASVFHPVLASAIYITGLIVEKVMIPLCIFSAVLSVSGNIGSENRISALCRTVGSVNKWIMAAIVTVFSGISTIYGFSAPSLDAVAAKTMKFAAGTLVPVVGGFLSDTLETVISASRLMKNAVGTAGVITVCVICFTPAIKIGVIHIMLRLSAAVSEPIADKRISTMLTDMASAVGGVFALTVMSAVLFIINLCIILAATNFG